MVNTEKMIGLDQLRVQDLAAFEEIHDIANRAIGFVDDQPWCNKLKSIWLADSVGHIYGIFLADIEVSINSGADDQVWVVVGDIPTAYLDVKSCKTTDEVTEAYVFLMREWISAVYNGQDVSELYPVGVPATIEWAKKLESRIKFIEKNILHTKP
jgi:hypothetical protein